MGDTSLVGGLIAGFFAALLLLAFVSLIVSILLYKSFRPPIRALLTVGTAFVISAILFGFDYGSWDFHPARTLVFIPSVIALGLVHWRMYADGWVDGDEGEDEKDELGEDGRPLWDSRSSANYLVCHWRGELSLPLAFWVNSVVVGFVLIFLLVQGVGQLEGLGASLQFIAAAMLFVLGAALALWLWGAVGTWRTCGRHRARGGRAGWANAARVVVVLSVFVVAIQTWSLILQSRELGKLALGYDPIGEPAEIRIANNGENLVVAGSLASGTASRFAAVLAEAPERLRTVTLASNGGRVLEARRIAAAIKERGLDTRVEGPCMSACTLLLLAGRERSASPVASIGFHQPSFPGFGSDGLEDATEELRQEYRRLGVEAQFVDRAMQTPAVAMWYPPHEELLAANVLTATEIRARAHTPESRARAQAMLEGWIARQAWRVNRDAPTSVDSLTTLEGAEADAATLTYRYRVAVDRRAVDVAAARASLARLAREGACDDPGLSWAVRRGGRMVYSFRDRGNRVLFDLPVTSCPEA